MALPGRILALAIMLSANSAVAGPHFPKPLEPKAPLCGPSHRLRYDIHLLGFWLGPWLTPRDYGRYIAQEAIAPNRLPVAILYDQTTGRACIYFTDPRTGRPSSPITRGDIHRLMPTR